MTAAAAVTAFPMVKVLRRGCAILSAEITSTIAYSNSVSFLLCFVFCFVLFWFFFIGGGVEVGAGEGDVSVCLGFTRIRLNQV